MQTTVTIKIRGFHTDQFKHVNHTRYLEFLEEGRWDYSEKNGLLELFKRESIGHATVNININYRKSAFADQVLRVETDLLRKGEKSITMQQKVFLDDTDTLIADAEVTNVYLNLKTDKIIPVDEEFIHIWPALAEI